MHASVISAYIILLLLVGVPPSGSTSSRLSSVNTPPRSAEVKTRQSLLRVSESLRALSPPGEPVLARPTVQEMAGLDPELSVWYMLMKDVGATFYLEQTRHLTMFMPVNTAFEELAEKLSQRDGGRGEGRRRVHDFETSSLPFLSLSSLEGLASLPWEVKWRLLQYHIIPNEILDLTQLEFDPIIETVSDQERGSEKKGKMAFVTWEGSVVFVEKSSINDTKETRARQVAVGGRRNPLNRNTEKEGDEGEEEGRIFPTIYKVGDATVLGEPPFFKESFNGPAYKISKVLVPPDLDLTSYYDDHVVITGGEEGQSQGSLDEGKEVDGEKKDPVVLTTTAGDVSESLSPPDFVVETNLAHAQWSETPTNRRHSLGLSSSAAPQQHNVTDSVGSLGVLAGRPPTALNKADDYIAQEVTDRLSETSKVSYSPADSTSKLLHHSSLLGPPQPMLPSSPLSIFSLSLSPGYTLPQSFGNPHYGWAPLERGWSMPNPVGRIRSFEVKDGINVEDEAGALTEDNDAEGIHTGEYNNIQEVPVDIIETPPPTSPLPVGDGAMGGVKDYSFPYEQVLREQIAPIHSLSLAPGLLPSYLARMSRGPLEYLNENFRHTRKGLGSVGR